MSIHEITGMEGDVIYSKELFYFARRRNFGKATVECLNADTHVDVAKRGEAVARSKLAA